MTEPLLKIVARFDIHEEPGQPLDGRAYISAYNFEQTYNSDLVYAVRTLRETVRSPALEAARQRGFKHTIALMWGDPAGNERMIDFLAWNYKDWQENAEISGWQTREGVIVQPTDGIFPVTCEGGEDILHAEKEWRRAKSNAKEQLSLFKKIGPVRERLEIPYDFDFCTPDGRRKLKSLM
ncbi:MAG: hypothetical protein WC796_05715 [Candidatus Pacearchaeota archaeon]|jgi:hypothetical protein